MTPSEQEREARESLANALSWLPPEVVVEPDALDQYRLAVRRAVVAEAVAVVEGLPRQSIGVIWSDIDAVNRTEALTALRGLSPEGE